MTYYVVVDTYNDYSDVRFEPLKVYLDLNKANKVVNRINNRRRLKRISIIENRKYNNRYYTFPGKTDWEAEVFEVKGDSFEAANKREKENSN
jgi:hypothetical protein